MRRLVAALALAWTVVWFQRGALGPAGPLVQAEFASGYAGLGLLSTFGVLGGACGYLLAALLAQRHPRATMLAGAALVAAATLGAWGAASYAALGAMQVLAGLGEGLFFVPALARVTAAAPPEKIGRALGTLDSGISLGLFLVLLAAAPLLPASGWRGLMLMGAAVGFLMLALLAALPRGDPPPAGDLREVLQRKAWPLYGAVTLLNVVYFAVIYLSPTLLVARGFDLPTADLVAAAAVGLGIPWHFLGGRLADRHGAARMATMFTLGVAGCLFLLSANGPPLATALFLLALYSLGIAGTVGLISLVPRMLGAHLAAPGFGVFWGIGYLGGAAGPLLMGTVADAWGFPAALQLMAVLAGVAAILIAPKKPVLPKGPAKIPIPLLEPEPQKTKAAP